MPNHSATASHPTHPYFVSGAPLTGTIASRLARVDGRLLVLGRALEAAASTPDALDFATECDRMMYFMHLVEDVAVMREELQQARQQVMPNHPFSRADFARPYTGAGAPMTGTIESRLARVDGRLLLIGKALEAAAPTPDALEVANEADRVLYWLHLAEDVAVMREELRQAINLDAAPGRQAVDKAYLQPAV